MRPWSDARNGDEVSRIPGWIRNFYVSRVWRMAIIALLMVAVFISDTVTDLEIATAVFYVIVILLAVGKFEGRTVVMIAATCILLTILSFDLTRFGSRSAGIVNCGISISAIAITTYIALKMVAAEKAAYEARAQLIRIARVNSLGEVATSIAHEVNQPLSAIKTSGDACLRWLAASPPNLDRARAAAGRMIDDAERASMIVARVRALAKGAPSTRRVIPVDDVIREAIATAQSEIERHDIALRLLLPDDAARIRADGIQLQQVLGNLILNAIEALADMPAHGRTLTVSAARNENGDIEIGVQDNGPGIGEEHLARIFDAFWTTKAEGTGIGLAISRSIVEAHGGAIWAERVKPAGIRFLVRLPAYRPAAS